MDEQKDNARALNEEYRIPLMGRNISLLDFATNFE